MNIFNYFALLVGVVSILVFVLSVRAVKKNKIFITTPLLLPLGIFVWGDGIFISIFWLGWSMWTVCNASYYQSLTLWSLFWVVRSLGEVIYWLHEQFAVTKRNNPKNLLGGGLFGEGIWFVYQVIWQCVLIIMIYLTILFVSKWV